MDIQFANNLKNLRKEFKYSQVALANMLGVTQQCVSEWELCKTEPTLTYLWKLADIFSLSMDVLCGRTEW